jgi:hypothetical protein
MTMQVNLEQAIAILEKTPKVLRAMLQDLPAEWLNCTEGEKTWSPFDVLGHLIHGEQTDWLPRLKLILQKGESEAFEPFDRFAQFELSRGKSLDELVTTFASLRAESLAQLRQLNLSPRDLSKTGRHPELGRVRAEELLATWVVHDLDHLNQISRTLAKQYSEAVGPWRAYLSILK